MLAVSTNKNLFGLGRNCEHQLCSNQAGYINTFSKLPINIKNQENIEFCCSNNFVLCLVSKPIEGESENYQENSKYKDL